MASRDLPGKHLGQAPRGAQGTRADRRVSPAGSFCSSLCQYPPAQKGTRTAGRAARKPAFIFPRAMPLPRGAGWRWGHRCWGAPSHPFVALVGTPRAGGCPCPGPAPADLPPGVPLGGSFSPKTRGAGRVLPAAGTRGNNKSEVGETPDRGEPEPPAPSRSRGGRGKGAVPIPLPTLPRPAPPPPPRFRPGAPPLGARRGRGRERDAGLTIPEQRLMTAVCRGRALTCPR